MADANDLPVTVEEARTLPVSEVAMRLLQYIATPEGSWAGNRWDIGQQSHWEQRGLDVQEVEDMRYALVEAWDWAHHRGRNPGAGHGVVARISQRLPCSSDKIDRDTQRPPA
jgi:hypothetical protein